jgi:hypothetical protein
MKPMTNQIASDAAYVIATMYGEDKRPVGIIPSDLELFDLMTAKQFRDMEHLLLHDHALHVVKINSDKFIICNESEVSGVLLECFASATIH